MRKSLPTDYFDQLYQKNGDPWDFEHSGYEKEKYAATLAALPNAVYQNAFEIGCSIGVLTQQLVLRCKKLLAVDGSEIPLKSAMKRLQQEPHVHFAKMCIPEDFPQDQFDLILVSEVGYYWSMEDLEKAKRLMINSLLPGGHLLLVHWILPTNYPLTGDQVHDEIGKPNHNTESLQHLYAHRTEQYRLDLWGK